MFQMNSRKSAKYCGVESARPVDVGTNIDIFIRKSSVYSTAKHTEINNILTITVLRLGSVHVRSTRPGRHHLRFWWNLVHQLTYKRNQNSQNFRSLWPLGPALAAFKVPASRSKSAKWQFFEGQYFRHFLRYSKNLNTILFIIWRSKNVINNIKGVSKFF